MAEISNFFDDIEEVKEIAELLDYSPKEYNGAHYPCFAIAPEYIKKQVVAKLTEHHNCELFDVLCTFRKGTERNTLIHTDISAGTNTAIVYISPETNTAFWKHLESGAFMVNTFEEDHLMYKSGDGNNPDLWELIRLGGSGVNTCSIYDTRNYHSIHPYENMPNRLVCVTFYTLKGEEQ